MMSVRVRSLHRLHLCFGTSLLVWTIGSVVLAHFSGGFITEHFGAPANGVHAVQIEIARRLYLDERTIVRTRKWTVLRDDLFAAAKALAHEFGGESEPRRLAAE